MRLRTKLAGTIGLLALLLLDIACGGGTSTTNAPPPPPPSAQLVIPTQSTPQGLVGSGYSYRLQATGGSPPYTWTTQLLGIAGLNLATDGTISGTPALPGTYIPNFTVKDSANKAVTAPIEIDIISPLTFKGGALMDQNVGFATWLYVQANGGLQPYTYSLAAGSSMPPGLTFQNSGGVGLIQGAPTTQGAYSFTIQVTDSFSPPMHVSQMFTMNVLNNLGLPQTTLPDAVINKPYQGQIQPIGGTPPYHFVLGQLSATPPGLKLDSNTGIISGTPTATTYDVMLVLITDSASPPATINPLITLTVQPPLSIQTTRLPDSARGLNYGGTINITGGRAPYSAQVVSGALPGGLSLGPSPYSWFNLSGVPNTAGVFNFTVQVADSYSPPNTAQQTYQVRISDPMSMSGPSTVSLLYNQPYTTTFPIVGGFPPYTWTMNPVPPGFTFDTTTGTLSGTPISGASYGTYILTAHDSSNPPLQANYLVFQMYVSNQLKILTSSLPNVAAGRPLWLGLQTSGGASPFTWSLSSGSLPSGLTFDTTAGVLHGTVATPGSYPFTVSVSDGNPGALHQTTSQAFTLVVKDPTLMQRNETLGTATPLSSIMLLGSISPYSDPSGSSVPDVDVYQVSAAPGTQVSLYLDANNDFLQPPLPNSFLPVLEVVDSTGTRYQTCTPPGYSGGGLTFNNACINGLNGTFYQSTYYQFQVPGSGTAPVTFYIRVSDARGDARPDFIYTLSVYGVN